MVEKKDSFKERQMAASESSKYKSQDNIQINENQFSQVAITQVLCKGDFEGLLFLKDGIIEEAALQCFF